MAAMGSPSAGAGGAGAGSVPAATIALLDGLMSANNAERNRAEEMYTAALAAPAAVVTQLMQVLCGQASEVHRSFSAVLLRRLLSYSDQVWVKLPPATQAQIKTALLSAVQTDKSGMVVRRICHAIAELCAVVLEKPGWPELMPCIFALVKGGDSSKRASALFLFNKVAEYCGDVIGPYAKSCIPWLTTALEDSINDVRVEALRATASLLLSAEDGDTDKAFRAIWPKMLKVLERTIAEDDLASRETLASVIDIAHLKPRFLRGVVNDTVQHMLIIAQHPDMDNELRKLALEFLIVLAEKAGSMARRCKLLVEQAVPLALTLMCTIEDDPEWNDKIDSPMVYTGEEYDDELVGAGEAGIDRMARSLGGALVMPVLSSLVMPMINDSDWKRRRAALVALALIGAGCKEQVWAALPTLLPILFEKLGDAHPRVRFASVQAIGQYASDFNESMNDDDQNFQDVFGTATLARLATVCSTPAPGAERVRGHAASAIVNVCSPRFCMPAVLGTEEQIRTLLGALIAVMRECRPQEQRFAMSGLACVAQVLGERFAPFYDGFMPLAQGVLATMNGKEHRQLRAQTMEAMALVGIAVGKERFAADGVKLLTALLAMQDAGIDSDDPQAKYVVQTCCFLSKVLDEVFVPFLPRVLPPLIAKAGAEAKVVFQDATEGASEGIEGLDTLVVEIRGMGKKRLGMDTVVMEDKATSVQMLNEYLGNLPPAAMLPYLDKAAAPLISNVRFAFGAGVRMSCLAALPKLITVALTDASDPAHAARLLEAMIPQLSQAVIRDNDMEVMCTAGESASEVMKLSYESRNPAIADVLQTIAPAFVPTLAEALTTSYQRCMERHTALAEDEDADEMAHALVAQQDDDEQEFLTSIVDAIGFLIKANKKSIMPVLREHVLPLIGGFLKPKLPAMFTAAAVCTLDDIVEHCAAGPMVIPMFVPVLQQSVMHTATCVRQAAVYGVGVCAEFGGAAFDAAAASFVNPLVQIAQGALEVRPGDDGALSADNAVSALFKLVKHRGGVLGAAAGQILSAVLQSLPLTADAMEARYLHKEVLAMVAAGDERVCGANYANLGLLLQLTASIMVSHMAAVEEDEDDKLLDDETVRGLPNIMGAIKARAGQASFDAAVTSLPEPVRQVLGSVMPSA